VGRRTDSPADDELGIASGGSPYPERPPCKNACGRRASKGRKGYCYTCGRSPGGKHQVRARARATGPGKRAVFHAVTSDEWQSILLSQQGRCYICGTALRNRYDTNGVGRTAALDHDHVRESELKKTGHSAEYALRASIRGLLCAFPCNRLLVRHWTHERLTRAAEYTRLLPAQVILAQAA
jgi:hypothetical protein